MKTALESQDTSLCDGDLTSTRVPGPSALDSPVVVLNTIGVEFDFFEAQPPFLAQRMTHPAPPPRPSACK